MPCNFCLLEQIRRIATKQGRVVTVQPGGIGLNVFDHYAPTLIPKDATMDHPNAVASMMEIGSRCGC